MKLANVIEGGLAGATTLSLIQEALHKIDPKAPQPFLHKSGVIKKLKKNSGKKKGHSSKLYIELAGELLATASYFGLTGLGKKKNAVLRGGLLGALAGLGAAFLNEADTNNTDAQGEHEGNPFSESDELQKKILTVAMYAGGGMLAGAALKKISKGSLKKFSKRMKKKAGTE